MPYDFDKSVERRNTHSLKWDVRENELPMWVADMDFQTASEILAVIQKRAAHGVFGFSMEKDWLIFCTGVVPAISSMVRKLTTVGENVLIQTPVSFIRMNIACPKSRLEDGLKRFVEGARGYEKWVLTRC